MLGGKGELETGVNFQEVRALSETILEGGEQAWLRSGGGRGGGVLLGLFQVAGSRRDHFQCRPAERQKQRC